MSEPMVIVTHCDECHQPAGEDIALRFDEHGTVSAQCRTCYTAMQDRELKARSERVNASHQRTDRKHNPRP